MRNHNRSAHFVIVKHGVEKPTLVGILGIELHSESIMRIRRLQEQQRLHSQRVLTIYRGRDQPSAKAVSNEMEPDLIGKGSLYPLQKRIDRIAPDFSGSVLHHPIRCEVQESQRARLDSAQEIPNACGRAGSARV